MLRDSSLGLCVKKASRLEVFVPGSFRGFVFERVEVSSVGVEGLMFWSLEFRCLRFWSSRFWGFRDAPSPPRQEFKQRPPWQRTVPTNTLVTSLVRCLIMLLSVL